MSPGNAESQTWSTRAVQRGETVHTDDLGGEAGIGKSSFNNGDVSIRATGEARKETNFSLTLTGGIITQLIKQVEDQLGAAEYQIQNADACIEWYRREKQEHQKRVESLREQAESLRILQGQLQVEE